MVSVIVPNYNHEKYLEHRLESIFNQTYQDIEVILLDDCSTDNSSKLLSKYKNHPKLAHLIINETNTGSPFKQWNKGIGLAKGGFIWIAESDDYCELDFLEQTLKLIKANNDVSLVYSQSFKVNAKGNVTGNWLEFTSEFEGNIWENNFMMKGNVFIENYLIHKNVIPNVSAVLFNKAYLEKITPLYFEPYMKYNADWYYYIQLLANSNVLFVANPLNFFRYHNTSVIAKAGEESGWLKILNMEIKMRSKMIDYLDTCVLCNINEIKKQHKKGNDILIYKKLKLFYKQGKLLHVLRFFGNKYILKKMIRIVKNRIIK